MSFLDFFSSTPKDQVSTSGIKSMLSNLDWVQHEILQFMEPGTEIVDVFAIDNALAEFQDPQIGLVYGEGSGHAFIRVAALQEVRRKCRTVDDFSSLVRGLRECGYRTKHIKYIRVRTAEKIPDIFRKHR